MDERTAERIKELAEEIACYAPGTLKGVEQRINYLARLADVEPEAVSYLLRQ